MLIKFVDGKSSKIYEKMNLMIGEVEKLLKETNIHIVTLKSKTLPTNYCLVLALIPRLCDTNYLATLVL